MPLAEFEPAIPASERPQNYALDRAATKHYGESDFSKDGRRLCNGVAQLAKALHYKRKVEGSIPDGVIENFR